MLAKLQRLLAPYLTYLTPDMYAASRGLRLWWCERNRNRVYVPEWLLEEWGIAVDGIFDRTA